VADLQIQKIVLRGEGGGGGEGVWDAVDTSPDLRGQKYPQNLQNGYSM